jgi:hypothetical protein
MPLLAIWQWIVYQLLLPSGTARIDIPGHSVLPIGLCSSHPFRHWSALDWIVVDASCDNANVKVQTTPIDGVVCRVDLIFNRTVEAGERLISN